MFNLNLKHKFSNNVDTNIKSIINNLGHKFIIKDDVEIPVKFIDVTQPNGLKHYALYYDTEKIYEQEHPIKILFVNIHTGDHDNSAYINNLSKTDNISGTRMMNIIFKFLKIINTKYVRLHDGATIGYVNLSLIKLLESGQTWYMKFGFKFDTSNYYSIAYKYKSHNDVMKRIHFLLDQFKKLTVDEMMEKYTLIANLESAEVICVNPHTMLESDYYKNSSYDLAKSKKFYNECLECIRPYSGKLLYECMLDLVKVDLDKYSTIESELLSNTPVYSYNDIKRDYCLILMEVNNIRNNYYHIMKL